MSFVLRPELRKNASIINFHTTRPLPSEHILNTQSTHRHRSSPSCTNQKLATQLAPVRGNPWWNEAGRRVTLAQKWHETQPSIESLSIDDCCCCSVSR